MSARTTGKTAVIVPSAGSGQRMGSVKKNYLELSGAPVLSYALRALEACPLVDAIAIAVAPGDEEHCRKYIVEAFGIGKVEAIVAGGEDRQASVYNALRSLAADFKVIAVHDGARPLIEADIIGAVIMEAQKTGAAICAVPVKDTIKEAQGSKVKRTVEREGLWSVQTPQAFDRGLLIEAHESAEANGFKGTDDAALVERLGREVSIVMGSYENIKITTPEDLYYAQCVLQKRALKSAL